MAGLCSRVPRNDHKRYAGGRALLLAVAVSWNPSPSSPSIPWIASTHPPANKEAHNHLRGRRLDHITSHSHHQQSFAHVIVSAYYVEQNWGEMHVRVYWKRSVTKSCAVQDHLFILFFKNYRLFIFQIKFYLFIIYLYIYLLDHFHRTFHIPAAKEI